MWTLKVKEIVESGVLGQLRLIRGAFTFMLDRPGNYRNDPKKGGGSIWDVGCYPISYARLLAGEEPLEVFGWQVIDEAIRTNREARFSAQHLLGRIIQARTRSSIDPCKGWCYTRV